MGNFIWGFVVGVGLGFLLWTDTGKLMTGTTKTKVKSELEKRIRELGD